VPAFRDTSSAYRSAADGCWANPDRVLRYLAQADRLPHRGEGEAILLDHVAPEPRRVLDLGTGNGRLIERVTRRWSRADYLGLDISEPMLDAAYARFTGNHRVTFIKHDLSNALPELGRFDSIITSLALHNLTAHRQRTLYEEVFELLDPGGVFCNLDHVPSPTPRLHDDFYRAIAHVTEFDDRAHEPVALATHLRWLRELEYDDVDCYWKWLELALVVAVRPG
jgi:trans-aconitate methyltransferase